jgi:hypothetical protein
MKRVICWPFRTAARMKGLFDDQACARNSTDFIPRAHHSIDGANAGYFLVGTLPSSSWFFSISRAAHSGKPVGTGFLVHGISNA